jgi:fibronectin-binding autotransporter adhesin
MATNTYVALDKKTVTSTVQSVEFTSIPQGYTDLILVSSCRVATGQDNVTFRLNSDTGSNYSYTRIKGNGSTAASDRGSNTTQGYVGNESNAQFTTQVTHFMNYSNSTTNKTVLSRSNATDTEVVAWVNLWRNTSAINTILVRSAGGGGFISGSTFSLYGIAAASIGAKATGGMISSDDNYWYHTFYNSGTFTPTQSLSAQVLAVGGGGGGGGNIGSGGGAGAMTTFSTTSSLSSGVAYTCTVGAAAAGGSGSANGTQGNTSSFAGSGFTTITALGGGAGRQSTSGVAGGSGSGGAPTAGSTGGAASGPNTNVGGSGYFSYPIYSGGGGGGATAVGGNGSTSSSIGGNGGEGYTISNIDSALPNTKIFGSMTVIASGGGGSGVRPDGAGNPQTGGTGGTGAGSGGFAGTNATNATSYGSGGGGGTWVNFSTGNGGNGQQGIIVVRYAKA